MTVKELIEKLQIYHPGDTVCAEEIGFSEHPSGVDFRGPNIYISEVYALNNQKIVVLAGEIENEE